MSFLFVCWHSRKWWPPIRGETFKPLHRGHQLKNKYQKYKSVELGNQLLQYYFTMCYFHYFKRWWYQYQTVFPWVVLDVLDSVWHVIMSPAMSTKCTLFPKCPPNLPYIRIITLEKTRQQLLGLGLLNLNLTTCHWQDLINSLGYKPNKLPMIWLNLITLGNASQCMHACIFRYVCLRIGSIHI